MLHNNCCYVVKISATRTRSRQTLHLHFLASQGFKAQLSASRKKKILLFASLMLCSFCFRGFCWVVQDNTVGFLCVPHPRATQGMGSGKARDGQQLSWHGWAAAPRSRVNIQETAWLQLWRQPSKGGSAQLCDTTPQCVPVTHEAIHNHFVSLPFFAQ